MSNGYSSYQIGQDEAQPENPRHTGPQIFIRDTVTRVSTTDGEFTEDQTTIERGTTGELNPYHGQDHWAATAQNPNGSPVTELLPTTLVQIDGVEAPISFWIKQGRITKAADGGYVDAGAAEETPQGAPEGFAPIDEATMQAVNQALDPLPQEDLDGLVAIGVGVGLGKFDRAAMVSKFSQSSGQSPEDSQARLDVIVSAYQAHADKATGIPADDLPAFWAWARRTKPGALQEAMQLQMHAQNVKGYQALARQWTSTTAPSVAALKAAGIPVRTQGTGVECFAGGSWMTPGAAARAGLL